MTKTEAVTKVIRERPQIAWDANSIYTVDDGQVWCIFSKAPTVQKHLCLVDAGGTQLFREV